MDFKLQNAKSVGNGETTERGNLLSRSSNGLRIFFLFVYLLFMTPSSAADAPQILRPQGDGIFPLDVQMEYLDDPSGSFSMENVIAGKAGQFRPLTTKNFGFAYKHKAMWVRFLVDFSKYDELYWFLVQNYEHVGVLSVCYPDEHAKYHVDEFVENSRPDTREFNIHQYLFKIPVLSKQPSMFYVRYQPDGHALNIDLSWADSKGAIENISNTQIGMGLFFGGLLVMWLYNFFLYLFLRDRTYLYYLYYLGAFIVTYLYVTGLTATSVHYSQFVQQCFAACAYASVHGMILFARHFLNLKTALRWFNSYLVVFQWIVFGGVILCFFLPTSTTFNAVNYLLLLIVPVLVACGGIRVYQRYQPAYLYFTGWTILGIGLALQAMRSLDILPSTFITNYAIQIAAVLEAIFFGLALANRVRLLEKEKLEQTRELLGELEKAVEKEKNAVKQKTLFIAAVNHELRTPLQLLTGSIEVLNHMANSASIEKVVGKISRAARQITAQMRDIGEYSRLEAGILSERPGKFLLSELLTGVVDDYNKAASAKGIALTVNCATPEWELIGDQDRIRQVLNNLVFNAIKFTEQGTVTIDESVKPIEGTHRSNRSFLLEITITDTGIGIRDDDLNKLFDPFTLVGTDAGNRGTGLGLAIVQRIVVLLNGDISVTSKVGRGTQFVVRLPVDKVNRTKE